MQDETKAREVLAAEYRKDGYMQMADGIERGQSPAIIRAMLAFASAPPDGEREEMAEIMADEYCGAHHDELSRAQQAVWTAYRNGVLATVSKTERVQTHQADREAIARVAAAEGVKQALTAAMMLEPPFNDLSSAGKPVRLERVSKTIVAAILALSPTPSPGFEDGIAAAIQYLRNLDTAEKPATQGHYAVWLADQMERAFGGAPVGECPSCGGLNTSCPAGCERDPKTGELLSEKSDALKLAVDLAIGEIENGNSEFAYNILREAIKEPKA